MGDLVNLRRVRKAKARTDAGQQADANRLRFGQARAAREAAQAQADLESRRLDAHFRDDDAKPRDR